MQQLLQFHTSCNSSSDKDELDEQVVEGDSVEQQGALNSIHKIIHFLQLQLSCNIR